jgi:hypothetical protein
VLRRHHHVVSGGMGEGNAAGIDWPFLLEPPAALSANAALPPALHGPGFSPSPWGISVANS